MHKFKDEINSKSGQSYLILQKEEWNRLKKQSAPQEQPIAKQKEYVKSLTEKSRAWTKTWPDHHDGVIASYEKKQRAQHNAVAAAVNEKDQQNKCKLQYISNDAIKHAKEKIFEGSCFGNKLLSAYRESKTLEERDLQVQFLKQLKEKKVIESKMFKTGSCSFDLDKYAVDEEKCRKSTRIQLARMNKEISETQKKEAAKAKEIKKKEELENIQFTKDMLVLEKKAEEKVKLSQNEALKQFLSNSKKVRKERAISEAEYQNKVIACQKQKEEMNNKINKVFREMHKVKDPWVNKVYENLAQIQEEETKLITMKMENNLKLGERRFNKREKKFKEQEKQALEKRVLIAESNKMMAVCVNQINKNTNKLSDRQCLIAKGEKDRERKKDTDNEDKERSSPHRLPVFGPCNKLMSALKKRMQQPPCWTGASAGHQQFARLADDLLRDCKYKNPGRKVVDEYIKYNKLDSLDVPNY